MAQDAKSLKNLEKARDRDMEPATATASSQACLKQVEMDDRSPGTMLRQKEEWP